MSERLRQSLRGHAGKPRPQRQSLRGRRGRTRVSRGAIAEKHDCRSEPTWEGEPVQESTGDTLRQSLRAHHGKPRPERQSLRGRLGKPWRHVGRWATSEHQRQSLRGHLAKPKPQRQSLRGRLGKPGCHFGKLAIMGPAGLQHEPTWAHLGPS